MHERLDFHAQPGGSARHPSDLTERKLARKRYPLRAERSDSFETRRRMRVHLG